MRFVSLGILAVLLCAGCALETGSPSSGDSWGTGTQSAPLRLSPHQGMQAPAPLPIFMDDSTGCNDNPEPSPWNCKKPGAPNPGNSGNGVNTQGATMGASAPNAIHTQPSSQNTLSGKTY